MPPDMGWLRLVGSLKSQVSFAEYFLFYRALLQKRPIILRSLRIVATPYAFSKASSILLWIPCVASHRSLLQNTFSFIGLFCKRDLWSPLNTLCSELRISSRRRRNWSTPTTISQKSAIDKVITCSRTIGLTLKKQDSRADFWEFSTPTIISQKSAVHNRYCLAAL